jgi:hypothetical protein
MSKERKSPQQKKELQYTRDHFTGGFNSSAHGFSKGWRRKKAQVNREYRRKSDELLSLVKPGLEAQDVRVIADELTTAHLQKSVTRRRLHKVGTISIGERVKKRLQRRAEAVGRKVEQHQRFDDAAAKAVRTLNGLGGKELVGVINRAELLRKRNGDELKRVGESKDAVDQALSFLYAVSVGSARELDALGRNPKLNRLLGSWIQKANRIMAKEQSEQERKRNEKETARQRLKLVRKASAGI